MIEFDCVHDGAVALVTLARLPARTGSIRLTSVKASMRFWSNANRAGILKRRAE
jgi:hypothetical protein